MRRTFLYLLGILLFTLAYIKTADAMTRDEATAACGMVGYGVVCLNPYDANDDCECVAPPEEDEEDPYGEEKEATVSVIRFDNNKAVACLLQKNRAGTATNALFCLPIVEEMNANLLLTQPSKRNEGIVRQIRVIDQLHPGLVPGGFTTKSAAGAVKPPPAPKPIRR